MKNIQMSEDPNWVPAQYCLIEDKERINTTKMEYVKCDRTILIGHPSGPIMIVFGMIVSGYK